MRKRYVVILIVLTLVVLLPVASVVVITQTGILRNVVTSRLNGYLPDQLGVEVRLGKVSGPYYRGLTVTDVLIINPDYPTDTIVYAERVNLSYHILELWRGQWNIKYANISGLYVHLPDDSTLHIWTTAFGPQKNTAERETPDFSIDTLLVDLRTLTVADEPRLTVDGLKLDVSLVHGEGQYALQLRDARGDLTGLNLRAIQLQGAGRQNVDGWTIDSLSVITPLSEISLSGSGNTRGVLDVTTAPLSLDELSRVTNGSLRGNARYQGTISFDSLGVITGQGKLSGSIQERRIEGVDVDFAYQDKLVNVDRFTGRALSAWWNGSGFIDFNTDLTDYGFVGDVRGFNLNRVAFETFESSLSGSVSLKGSGLRSRDLQMGIDVELEGRRFDSYTFDSAAGHLEVNTDVVTFADGFEVRYKNTTVDFSGFLEYEDSLDILANVYFDDLSDFTGQTFIDSLDGRGYAYCNLLGETASPDLIGRFDSDSLRVFDLQTTLFYGTYNIPNFFDNRGGWADLHWGRAVGWTLPIDSLIGRLRFDGTQVYFDSSCAYFPAVFLCAEGQLDWGKDTVPVEFFKLAGDFEKRQFYAVDTVHLSVDSVGFSFAPLEIDGDLGRLRGEGTIDFNTNMDLQLTFDEFQFEPYWHRQFPDLPLAGILSWEVTLGGDFDQPMISGSGAVDSLTYDGEYLGELSGNLSYADSRLTVDTFQLVQPLWQFTGSCTSPVDLSFGAVDRRLLDAPQDFRFYGKGTALDPVVWFLPDVVESVAGPWNLTVRLSGTPAKPRFEGQGYLVDGVVKAVELQDPIENLDIGLELSGDTVRVVGATGQIINGKNKGTISADGTIQVVSLDTYNYNLRIIGKEVPARFEFSDYQVTADLDLTVTGATPPLVAGSIDVLKGEDREELSYEEEYEFPDSTVWDWDIAVVSPGNYWLRNDQINAELSFDLRLLRDNGIISILGTAEIVPGRSRVYIFDRVGRIEHGTLIFDEVSNVDPQLDLEISFRIPSAGGIGSTDQTKQQEFARDVDLKLLVSGRGSEPLIRAVDGSPYSEQDILLLLAANRPATLGDESSEGNIYLDRIKFAASGLLFSQLERMMGRAIGLETISLNTGSTTADTELTLGGYFSRNFYVYGTSPVALDRGQDVGFEFRFRRGLYLDGKRDRDNLYRLNLHLNWEY